MSRGLMLVCAVGAIALLAGCTNPDPIRPTPPSYATENTVREEQLPATARLLALPTGFSVPSANKLSVPGWTDLAQSEGCLLSYRGGTLPPPATAATYREASVEKVRSTVLSEQGTNASDVFDVFLAVDPASQHMAGGPLGINAVAQDFAEPQGRTATRVAARVASKITIAGTLVTEVLEVRFSCAGDAIETKQWDALVEVLRLDFAAPYEHRGQWPAQTIESDYARIGHLNSEPDDS